MISFEEALDLILDTAWQLPAAPCPLLAAQGRVLAERVVSDINMPPFNKSSMDGYACRRADLDTTLAVIEHIPAGRMPEKSIGPGQCAKVMTGAPVPKGADCVIIVEEVEAAGEDHVRFVGTDPKSNIVPLGEDLRIGAPVLAPHTRILAQHLPILAAVGCAAPLCSHPPAVGVFSTGDELVPVERTPEGAQIRNSNSFQLVAQAQDAGATVTNYGIVADNEADHRAAFTRALEENDVVLSTGGVSMGDYDLVPDIVAAHGLDIRIRKIAIQPGKPMIFAVGNEKAVFGLSGNPVSSFLQMELFVKPFLLRLQGASTLPATLQLPIDQDIARKSAQRMAWFPVALTNAGMATPLPFHGSAHIFAFAHADGIAAYPEGVDTLSAGDRIAVRLIR